MIGSKKSYDLIADYFKSWVGREDTALMNNVEVHLKKNRYAPDVINIYETLFRDERNHPNTRTRIIVAFLTNKPVFIVIMWIILKNFIRSSKSWIKSAWSESS
ncbi:MAG: hypothetical protein ACPGSB_06025, partial [Opitutales bacterium]